MPRVLKTVPIIWITLMKSALIAPQTIHWLTMLVSLTQFSDVKKRSTTPVRSALSLLLKKMAIAKLKSANPTMTSDVPLAIVDSTSLNPEPAIK